ncbi:hypothetical protein SUDANB51_00582 [Streptomyces sp. enrichment culture]
MAPRRGLKGGERFLGGTVSLAGDQLTGAQYAGP